MNNELKLIEEQIKKEVELKGYDGFDRVVSADEKWTEVREEQASRPPFRALSGIKTLDDTIGGFRKGRLIVLSGPPKNGKSACCMTISKNFTQQGIKSLWLEYELMYDEFFDSYPGTKEGLQFFTPNYMYSGNLEWVENRIIEAKKKFGIEAVFIDHLDFLRDPKDLRKVEQNMSSYVGGIVQKLKSIAVQQELIMFLMAHLRKTNWTSNELPKTEEIRDSGQIPQLADIVMMMMRQRADRTSDEIYHENFATLGVMENRQTGKTKKINLQLRDKEFFETDYWHKEEIHVDF